MAVVMAVVVVVVVGDWVFGDETGLIKISKASLDEVLKLGAYVESLEDEIVRRISVGESLFDIVDSVGRI